MLDAIYSYLMLTEAVEFAVPAVILLAVLIYLAFQLKI